MKVYRIKISSWTASFRYPNLISGFQPTLEVPPISTVLGLINAASGRYIDYSNEKYSIGYYFEYDIKTVDLETIYQVELKTTKSKNQFPGSTVKSNVINREFLYDCSLYIYSKDKLIKDSFQRPFYPILLGRSGDLATVDEIKELNLKQNEESNHIRGQIIPFNEGFVAGEIQALPQYFSDTIPRKNIGTQPYSIIPHKAKNVGGENLSTFADSINGKPVDIYFHQLDFSDL